jgi:hypothetical protein
MNPFTWFMQLKPAVKIVLISCITVLILAFMYFAVQTDTFDLIVKGLFEEAKK